MSRLTLARCVELDSSRSNEFEAALLTVREQAIRRVELAAAEAQELLALSSRSSGDSLPLPPAPGGFQKDDLAP